MAVCGTLEVGNDCPLEALVCGALKLYAVDRPVLPGRYGAAPPYAGAVMVGAFMFGWFDAKP